MRRGWWRERARAGARSRSRGGAFAIVSHMLAWLGAVIVDFVVELLPGLAISLTDKLSALECLCSTLEAHVGESAAGVVDTIALSTVRRYHDLVGNLHLSEDEVDALLTEGPSWPPIRAHLPESSLVDLLWLLTDRQDERDEEKHALEDRVANAEAEARAQKERADAAVAAAASAPRLTVEAGRANGEVDPARQEREKSLEAEVKSARENKARDKETISQLEARILAYEANGGFCFSLPSQLLSPVGLPFDAPRMLTFQLCAASRLERSPSRASWGGVGLTVTSGFSQGVVDRFTSTITDLNQQVSELRDENTTLLLQLAGVDE
ncbi:hypothetical protein DMC30DRAFT_264468 [Rhodotorula diobovata]|uniref:Uncharacterized protein n=1 Tax=Rhodotorula diobovata TaxID=5288 RepID=A0A5C5FX25_9BASI|nr:hypothetical protein DMC30DRAFT_264468 [Rhodotorula diobovata]